MIQRKRKRRLAENHDQEVEKISEEATSKNQSKDHQKKVERSTETHLPEVIHTLLQSQAVVHQGLEDLRERVKTDAKKDNLASTVGMMKEIVQKTEKDSVTINNAK